MREERARTIQVPFAGVVELALLKRARGDIRAEGPRGIAELRHEATAFADLVQRAEVLMAEEMRKAEDEGWPKFLNGDPYDEATRAASRAFLRIRDGGIPEIELRCSIEIDLTDQP